MIAADSAYHGRMTAQTALLSDDDCYLALKAKDARFDGRFFSGFASVRCFNAAFVQRDRLNPTQMRRQAPAAAWRADVNATIAQLKALPGMGDWTAQYIALRALRWPDAFPAGDVALHKMLGVQERKLPAREAEKASLAWKPWRSYGVIRAWSGLLAAAPALSPSPNTPESLSNS